MMIQTQIIKWKVQTMVLPNFFLLDKLQLKTAIVATAVPFPTPLPIPGPMPEPAWWENEGEGDYDD